MFKIKCSDVQQHLYVTVTSHHWPCEGWPGCIIQLHDTCSIICILLPLAQVQCRFKQLEAVLHAQPLPIQRHTESLLLAFYLWSNTDWGINQQANAGPGAANWNEVKAHIQTWAVLFIMQSKSGYVKPQLLTCTLYLSDWPLCLIMLQSPVPQDLVQTLGKTGQTSTVQLWLLTQVVNNIHNASFKLECVALLDDLWLNMMLFVQYVYYRVRNMQAERR